MIDAAFAQTAPQTGAGSLSFWSNVLPPLLSFAFGLLAAFAAVGFDLRKSRNQELVKKRIQIYDSVAPKLNDILCHFTCHGNWAAVPPPTIIQHKRELDRHMHLYASFFSPELFDAYDAFINHCFATFSGGVGQPAKIRADLAYLKFNWGEKWLEEWNQHYVPTTDATLNRIVRQHYDALAASFAREVGVRRRGDSWLVKRWRRERKPGG